MKYSELTSKIIAAAFEVHNRLHRGYPEVVYQRALAIEFNFQNIKFQREKDADVLYREFKVYERRVDFFVENIVCLETKAVSALDKGDIVQAKNFLESNNYEIGLLINFGASKLQFHRITNKEYKPPVVDLNTKN